MPVEREITFAFQPIALLIYPMPYNQNGARSAQGVANRRRPLHPRALAAESPLRGTLSLCLAAFGSGAR